MSGQSWMPGDVYFGTVDKPLPDWRSEVFPSDTEDVPLTAREREAIIRLLGFDPQEIADTPSSHRHSEKQ